MSSDSTKELTSALPRRFALLAAFFVLGHNAAAVEISSGTGLSVRMDATTGVYELVSTNPAWSFAGSVGRTVQDITTVHGWDSLGGYERIHFCWQDGQLPMIGEIRLYDRQRVALFSDRCGAATELPPPPFPAFTNLPEGLHVFSYQQQTFAPFQFAASDCSTPWLLFDDNANALVISPASHFMVASLFGDGRREMASGFNPQLRNLPGGFTQQTIIAFGGGINATWDLWGQSLTRLEGARRPGGEADDVLKYLGYWTDNGAFYYYNYDPDKGYAGTLQAVVEQYRREQIPIRYLQLDSWWYSKTCTGPDGRIGKTKNNKLPDGEWNRYGGLLEYKAHPFLFPDGMAAFQKSIGLPLVTHNRWIDPASPYHQSYKISGLAAVDPKWWNDIAAYLKSCGVTTYEQDWCDRIYKYSPAFSSNVDTAEEFLDDMAAACRRHGMTMQYCMPYPCFFLQGARYENLTSIRTSDDRLDPRKWASFLYGSRFAGALGIRPWTDVFNSAETNNLLLATLSSGPVGIGDALGAEDKANLLKSVRSDGVIVKPDVPIVPLDQSYLAAVRDGGAPLIAGTFTDHGGIKTEYLFAFNKTNAASGGIRFSPGELGYTNSVLVYDYFSGTGRRLGSGETFSATLGPGAAAFYIVAPIAENGIAFLGDRDQFVSTGKERIASIRERDGALEVKVIFAAGGESVTLHGYAPAAPRVSVSSGAAGPVEYDPGSGHFSVDISTVTGKLITARLTP
jgi:hypothetical protein